MSQLVQIRQRIKAIETIQKITHAMRLISMSSHSRLRAQEKSILAYKEHIQKIIQKIPNKNFKLSPFAIKQNNVHHNTPHLVIIVGSQKGLCGSFNNALASFFYKKQPKNDFFHTIFVGKKAQMVFQEHSLSPKEWFILDSFEQLSPSSFSQTAQDITNIICNAPIPYASVITYSMHPKSFFVQEPLTNQITPCDALISTQQSSESNDIIWDTNPKEIAQRLFPFYIQSSLLHILYNSLLAEYAARFVSMDSATRNAHHLLESTQLVYNKLRQAKITKELTELTGAL